MHTIEHTRVRHTVVRVYTEDITLEKSVSVSLVCNARLREFVTWVTSVNSSALHAE